MAKMKKVNWKSKKTWRNILVIFLAIITLVGAVVGITALFRKSEETTKTISPSYAIGGLDEKGAYVDTKESIYTKDAFECYGLKTTLAFDNNISYRIYFYDENNEFLQRSEQLTSAFDCEKTLMPANTKSARIVITPNEDSKISWYEKNGYAKQLTIKVNKDQTKSDGVEIVLKNYFELDSEHQGYLVGSDQTGTGAGVNGLKWVESSTYNVSKPVDVSGYRGYKVKIKFNNQNESALGSYIFTDANDKIYVFANFTAGVVEYEIDILSTFANLYVNYANGCEPIINIITE